MGHRTLPVYTVPEVAAWDSSGAPIRTPVCPLPANGAGRSVHPSRHAQLLVGRQFPRPTKGYFPPTWSPLNWRGPTSVVERLPSGFEANGVAESEIGPAGSDRCRVTPRPDIRSFGQRPPTGESVSEPGTRRPASVTAPCDERLAEQVARLGKQLLPEVEIAVGQPVNFFGRASYCISTHSFVGTVEQIAGGNDPNRSVMSDRNSVCAATSSATWYG